MVAKDKIRIYDLARESVPESVVDAKAQKKIQTEITRRILESAPRFGSYPKTASSSIEANVAENLLKEIDIDSIVGEYGSSSSSSSSTAKASLASESPAAQLFTYKWGMQPQLFENNSHNPKDGSIIKGIKYE